MRHFLLTVPVLLLSTVGLLAQEHKAIQSPDQLKWQPGPPGLPQGAEFVVLSGDPAASSGYFAVRLKVPAGYKVPPHNHPTTEQVTVLSGDFGIGMGDKFDESKGQEFKPGGFANMPAKMNHFAWSKNGAVFQLQGQSPLDITYVAPADAPRNQ